MGPVTLYISQKQKEGGRTTTLRGVKIALRLWDAFCSLSIPNGRSERSWGWESPQGVRVEGWRHANRQSPGDIWVSVSPIQGTVRPYRWHRNAAGCELCQCRRDPDGEEKSPSFSPRQKKTMCYLCKAPLIVHVKCCPVSLVDGCLYPG